MASWVFSCKKWDVVVRKRWNCYLIFNWWRLKMAFLKWNCWYSILLVLSMMSFSEGHRLGAGYYVGLWLISVKGVCWISKIMMYWKLYEYALYLGFVAWHLYQMRFVEEEQWDFLICLFLSLHHIIIYLSFLFVDVFSRCLS